MVIKFNNFFKKEPNGFIPKGILLLCMVVLFSCFTNQQTSVLGSICIPNSSFYNVTILKNIQPLSATIGPANLNTCKIEIINFTGNSITVAFSGLPANQSSTNNNFIAIWEASSIPWTVEPIKKIDIGINAQSGTLTIDGLTITYNSYVVGYGVGPGIGYICASMILNTGGTETPPSYVHIGIEYLGTTSLSVNFHTLSGYLPEKNGNWIGLWEGYVSPYNLPPVALIQSKIDSYSNEGIIALNNLALGRNTEYTLIYFMGEENTSAAAMLTFNTSESTTGK